MAISETNTVNINLNDLVSALKFGNQNSGKIADILNKKLTPSAGFSQQGLQYDSTGGTLATGTGNSAGILVSLSITLATTAGSSQLGKCYDCADPKNASSTNALAVIPSSGYILYNIPFANGLVIQPSSISTQTVCVSYTVL